MVQSAILHPNVQLTDVTQRFHDAAKKVKSGHLIKDEHFTLFEAVGALEIGDAKMDSGCLEDGEEMDDDFDVAKSLSEAEVIWLIDELICREAAWHNGYPLSQTLFTSIHLDRLLWPDPKQLPDAHFIRNSSGNAPNLIHDFFRSYCLGLIKCCDLVLAAVTSQHYYEEEDFATQLFNREMLHRFSTDEVLRVMRRALDQTDANAEQTDARQALIARLECRYSMLELLQLNASRTTLAFTRLKETLDLLQATEVSSPLGQPLPVAFSVKIQRRLASSVPPRPMVVLDRKEAFKFFKQLMTDATTAFEVFDANHSGDLFTGFWSFMSQIPQPSAYVRAVMQSFLNLDDKVLGRHSLKDFIFEDLRLLVLPTSKLLDPMNNLVEAPSDNRFKIAAQLNEFALKIGQSYLNQYRTFCLNRCRIRRTLCHAALEWDQIQADAEDIDSSLQPLINEEARLYPPGADPTYSYPLSSWLYHYKLLQLRLITQLGFELSIYTGHEFAQLYWYLGHICGVHLLHLERISYFVSKPAQSKDEKAFQTKETDNTLRQLYRHFSWLKATESLAKSLHRLYTLLRRHGHFSQASPTYASDALRFELRMRPFQHLAIPEPLTFQEMGSLSSLEQWSDTELLDQASRLSMTAKKTWEQILKNGWHSEPLVMHRDSGDDVSRPGASVIEREWTRDVRNSMRACIGTSIFASTITKLLQDEGKSKASEDLNGLTFSIPSPGDRERFHSWWAVPKISN